MFSRSSTNGGLEVVISLHVELAYGFVLPHKLVASPAEGTSARTHMYAHGHAHKRAHVVDCDAHKKEQQQKKLHAQHKASCWSNYRNMAEHDEAGPSIRKEIE